VRNALTVDVEDWYMTSDFHFDVQTWDSYEDRVVGSTMQLLELFAHYRVQGTFFVLGCVAEKHPELVEEIVKRGHEVASHGGWHQMINKMSLEQFREDLLYSKRVLEEITGTAVKLFRAPSWSITPDRYDVLKILAEEGFSCDSSLQPFRTPLSGVAGAPVEPFVPVLREEELDLLEFPPTVLKMGGITLPFCGGFYLRSLPAPLLTWALQQVNRTRPGLIYVHPWEVDTEQPRLKCSPLIKFVHYYNLGSTKRKLEFLLEQFAFTTLSEVIGTKQYPSVRLPFPMGAR
jgi:polysaccharide deacetylase family protein (PEP-CTERM system associated)